MSGSNRARNFSVSQTLSRQRRQAIDALVEEVRKRLGFETPPLTIDKIETALAEVQIAEVPASPVASEIFYIDSASRIAQIHLRAKDVTAAKLLHACHALGHYFLHPKEPFACRMDFYGEVTAHEAEATYFAETLIMPNALLRRLVDELAGEYDPVYKIAKCFSVKRQIVEDRLSSLELP